MRTRDAEHVVVNHAAGKMIGPMATALTIRDFPPFVSDEPDNRLERLADLVGRYCPVDGLMRAAVEEYLVTWERL